MIVQNIAQSVLASAARTATNTSGDFINVGCSGIDLIFDITAVPGTDTVTLTIQGKDPVSGKYYTLLAGAAQSGVATVRMRIYPGLTAVANVDANGILPSIWRVSIAHSAASSFTYSVGAHVVV